MRTDCGKTKRTRRYFMNDAFIISSKFQNLFLFSKTLVRMFNGLPKSSARSRCHFHQNQRKKNNRQKSPKIFTHTLYVKREKNHFQTNRTTFSADRIVHVSSVFLYSNTSVQIHHLKTIKQKKKNRNIMSRLLRKMSGIQCAQHIFPVGKISKLVFFLSRHPKNTKSVTLNTFQGINQLNMCGCLTPNKHVFHSFLFYNLLHSFGFLTGHLFL